MEPVEVDVRIIAATQMDLGKAVKGGEFSGDFYELLSAARITLSPLSKRPEDIPALAKHFCSTYRDEIGTAVEGLTQDGIEAHQAYDWPGNIRELRNLVECLVLSARPGITIDREVVVIVINAKQSLLGH